jgi:hypothetical protein
MTAMKTWAAPVAIAVAFATGSGACGGSDEPAYCADRAALEQSLNDLGDVDLQRDGVDALTNRLAEVEQDATALARSARDEFGPEAARLRSAIGQLEDAAREVVASPSAQSVSDVAASAGEVSAAFGELSDAVSERCD